MHTSADDPLASALRLAETIPFSDIPTFLGAIEQIRVTAEARLYQPKAEPTPKDELISVEEAAKRLGISKAYLYANSLPFIRRIGRRRLCSVQGMERWLKTMRGG